MSDSNDWILAFLPSANCVAIQVYYNKPEIMTSEEEDVWKEQSRQSALHLKGQLELGTVRIDTVMNRLILNALPYPFPVEVSQRIIRELTGMRCPSYMDRDLKENTKKIRKSVTLSQANTELCLQLLEQNKRLPINKLLLIANPRAVGTIRNLRTYVGNLGAWNFTADEEVAFLTQSVKIRMQANLIYDSFKTYFKPMPEHKFWQYFIRMAMVYKAYIIEQRQQ